MTAAEVETPVQIITGPGLVHGMSDVDYHADPVAGGSLSHSGAKTIVTKTPALFAYEREHGRPDKTTFDVGHAAHQMILGVGPDLEVVEGEWRTKAAKDAVAAARLRGAVPLHREDLDTVTAMAETLRAHPLASKLLAAGTGDPEVSAFAQDPDTGVWLRCRYDWLRHLTPSGRLICVDYKTAVSAREDDFTKTAVNYGYHLQDVFYSEIAKILDLASDVAFLFVVQEKAPPYLVNVIQLDVTARRIGALLRRRAIDAFRDCTEADAWPGYGDDVTLASLPAWYERQFEDALST